MTTEDENPRFDDAQPEAENSGAPASRARNRTVMLTPEITGEVRARLAQDMAAEQAPTANPVAPPMATPSMASPTPMAAPITSAGFDRPESGFAPTNGVVSAQAVSPAAPQTLEAAPPTTPSPYLVRQGIIWSKPSPVAGFLVSFDQEENGEIFELRMGRLIVTSEAPGAGNFLVLDDETVSPVHAILRIAKHGEVQILDQLSEHGTKILRAESGEEDDLSGEKSTLNHGDIVSFGERKFHVCLIPSRDE